MKILLTCDPEIPVPPKLYGGIERIVEGLVNTYVDKGHDVTLCAHPESKVPCKLVGWKGRKSQNITDILLNTLQLSRLVYSQKFDIVHSFSRLAYMAAIMPFSIPKIMSYQREPSTSQIKKAVKLSKKGSLTFTGCSNYITQKIQPHALAVAIHNFAPVEKYTLTTALDDDAPLVFLGRIEPVKGTHIAIEIAQRTQKKLVIAGNISPNETVYFETMIKPHLNEQIRYISTVDDVQKNDLLGNALALLMPIQWDEPFGIVMAEAMACGTPVLGFARGAVPEVVTQGHTGFIGTNLDELCDKVPFLHQLDRTKIRHYAEARFSRNFIANCYLDLYAQRLNSLEEI